MYHNIEHFSSCDSWALAPGLLIVTIARYGGGSRQRVFCCIRHSDHTGVGSRMSPMTVSLTPLPNHDKDEPPLAPRPPHTDSRAKANPAPAAIVRFRDML
jgi:hypothetical protein